MKTLCLIILAFVLAIPARAQVHLLVTTNGALMAPVDFFTLNSNLIVAAVGGAFGGGGTGNASTNVTQVWAAANTQTFLGPVYFGTTNVVTELAGKQNTDAQLDVVANLTSGTSTNFLAGDGTFKQVTTNMVPGLVADILAAAAAGGGGTGDVVGPASSTDATLAVFLGTSGKVITNAPAIAATNVQTITAAVAAYEPLNANKYQGTNSVLTTLGTLDGAALTNLNASSIATGTVADARIDSAIARLASPALTGTLNWTNATSLAIPADNNPTTDSAGEVAVDSNGDFVEVYAGTAAESRVIPTLQKCSVTILDPDGVQAIEDAVPILPVESTWAPHGITIKDIYVKIDSAVSYAITLEEWTDPTTASSDIETVTVSSGTEAEDDGTLSDASVAAGSIVFVDLPTTAANFVTVTFTYIINPGN